jgi:PAS domain S-box-containing protein
VKYFEATQPVLEQIFEFAPDAIIGINEAGEMIFFNAQVEHLFGYPREELRGKTIEVLVPERYRGHHAKNRDRYFEQPVTRPMGAGFALYGLRSDGTEFPAEISLSSVGTEHGIIATAAIRDVTEQRRAQRAFEQLLEFAPDAIVGIDERGKIVLANAHVEQVFGYDRLLVLGQSIEMLVPERFRASHARHRGGFFSDPKARPMGAGQELYGLRADGTEFPAEISLSSIEVAYGTLATAAIRDVSDRISTSARS